MESTRDRPSALVCHKCGQPMAGAHLGDRCAKDGSALVPEADHLKCLADPILGRVLGGKYPIVGFIGAGGMGAVYRALQEPVGREVAVKVIRATGEYGEDGQTAAAALRSRFLREARVVAQLSNPSTVTLHDYGVEPDGVLFMVLELIKGQRLDRAIKEDGPFNPVRTVAIARQILNALSEAHGLGLVHRDLKPDNIMLVKGPWGEEQAKVLDFGIAKVLDTDNSAGSQDTRTGAVLGTPRYMAPEQATGQGEPRSDLYALSVVLYEMLSGHAPFVGKTPFETLLRHRTDPIPPLARDLAVPQKLEAVIRRGLAKDSAARFEDAHQMAAALLEAVPMASNPELAARSSQEVPAPRRSSRPSPSETVAAPPDEKDPSQATQAERGRRGSFDAETVVQRAPTRRPSSHELAHEDQDEQDEPEQEEEEQPHSSTAVLDVLDAPSAADEEVEEDATSTGPSRATVKVALLGGVLAVVIVAGGWMLYLTRSAEPVGTPQKVSRLPPAVHVSAPPVVVRDEPEPDAGDELAGPVVHLADLPDAGATRAVAARPDPTGKPVKKPPVRPTGKPHKPGTKNGEAGYEMEIF